jgi:outer membrane cobalamin receptor
MPAHAPRPRGRRDSGPAGLSSSLVFPQACRLALRPRQSCKFARHPTVFVLVAAFMLVAAVCAAQARTGQVAGVVTDPGGARVAHASVVLAAPSGAVVSAAETDAAGAYRLEGVPPGVYELRVSAEGFRADVLTITVREGEQADALVGLHLSAVSESIVVSAAQVELPLTRAADSVTVMTARDLAAGQFETVADALRTSAGLTVSRNGGRGAVTSLFPRGGESDFTLVLVDGIKMNAFGGGYDFSTLAATGIDRIEVVRGPQSALFGADAIGGVVQVVSRSGGRPTGQGSLEMGSFDTRRATASGAGSARGWRWGASVEHVTSDGFEGVAPATGETVSNDDSRATQGSVTGAWSRPGGADVRATANLSSSERGFPGPFGSNPIGAYTAVDRLSRGTTSARQYGARWLQPLTGRARLSTSGSYSDLTSDFNGEYGLSASSSRRVDVRTQADVTLSETASLSAGVEAQRERATSTFITGSAAGPVPIDRSIAGVFGELRLQPAGHVSVTAGVRAERIERDRLEQNPDPYAPRPPFGVDVQTSVNPRVSAAFFVPGVGGDRGWMRLHAAAGTGIRAPDALEIAFTDNPALKPERSASVEAGVEQALAGERLLVGATAFFNRYKDLIVAVGPAIADASQYRTDNISNARSSGLELSASVRPARGFDARVTYTFLSTAVLAVDSLGVAPAPFQVGDPLLRRPRHQASVDATWSHGGFVAFARVGARGRSLDVEPTWGTYGGLFENPGFGVADAGASYRVVHLVEVFGRVCNLFDRHYEETYGFPALGRNAMLGVRVAAGR